MKTSVNNSTNNVLGQIRSASLDQFKIYIKSSEVTARDRSSEELAYVQQLAHILVSGDDIEINFKVHFMLEVAKNYTIEKLGNVTVSDRLCVDFVKEYCNLVAGKAKAILETVGLSMGQSLPFAMQGYNELFYQRDPNDCGHDAWTLHGPKGSVYCSVGIRILNTDIEALLSKVIYQDQFGADSGSVELF